MYYLCITMLCMIILQVDDVNVVGVMQIDKHSDCMKCGAKVVSDGGDSEIGTCQM